MDNIKTIKNEMLNEEYYEINHSSGLKIFVMPKKDYSATFAMFATKYGSVDTCFKTSSDKDYVTVPEGIAHFLEHKLFESEELDAFERFEKTGASANAFTSFDRTCYIFQCTDNFEQSLEILLDFVKSPYFTKETVDKEQGIIGQEIKMYQDNPDWRVLFNMLKAIYHKNPVNIDIAGTVESISQITADLLYSCYNTFYNLSNMALAVAGNVTVNQVLEIADKILKNENKVDIERAVLEESEETVQSYTEQNMGVDIPKFAFGFKEKLSSKPKTAKEIVCMNILLDIIGGKVSNLYEKMLSDGIINPSFSYEYFYGRGFSVPMFSGESRNPEKVCNEVIDKIKELKSNGISDEDFEISRKRLYGLEIRSFNDVDDLANSIIYCYFNSYDLFSFIECYKTVTKNDIEQTLKSSLDPDKVSLSVVK